MDKKKLIEVALPLEDINREAAREKSIRHGHPSTLHLWWARRPLAACRAVLFASLVDDPSAHPDKFRDEEEQLKERERLFDIIRELVKWENSNDQVVLEQARAEILKSCDGEPPPVLDPFAGGGSIPLEAQRLGLEAHASDLNPVAVLINKALIEIPPRFADQPPVHPDQEGVAGLKTWRGAQGLAEDVRYYGRWIRDEAQRRIGYLYPKVQLPEEHGGGKATVIAWIWARTVQSPNPAWSGQVPLVRSFALSTKKGKETWVEPIVDPETQTISFEIRSGHGTPPDGTVARNGARCIATGTPIPFDYIRSEAKAGRMGQQLMAIVAEGKRQRVYLAPERHHEHVAAGAVPDHVPSSQLPEQALGFRIQAYGMQRWADLFTSRQLVALTTFSDLISEVRDRIRSDMIAAGNSDDPTPLRDGGSGARAYAEAVSTYLGLAISRLSDICNSMVTWSASRDQATHLFTRQAIPMVWDFTEVNPFTGAAGDPEVSIRSVARTMNGLPVGSSSSAEQLDATAMANGRLTVIATDPPYYDNIGYADLSDFFYVWLRRSLNDVYPDLFATLLVPKSQELIASPDRFPEAGKDARNKAEEFFESGLRETFGRMHAAQDPRFPLTVFYAFKQAETSKEGVASTGWETMLQSLVDAGFVVDGTWPLRSERGGRMRDIGSNALATSIVLACRKRREDAGYATRRDFMSELRSELTQAVRHLQQGNIEPVDLAQAAIGPGMAVYSRYAKVVEADGTQMPVRTALELINQVLDEVLAGAEGNFDADTRWAVTWFEEQGMNEGDYGRADLLCQSRNTSVAGLAAAGIIVQRPGKVRLRERGELSEDWDPGTDRRITAWEVAQHLIRRKEAEGEEAAAALLNKVGSAAGELAKELAYRLYLTCERKGWAKEAVAYNDLVSVWPELSRLARSIEAHGERPQQTSLL